MNAMSIDLSPVQNDQAGFDLPPLEFIFGKDTHNSRFNKGCGNEVTQPCVVKELRGCRMVDVCPCQFRNTGAQVAKHRISIT